MLFKQLTEFMDLHNSLKAKIYSVVGDQDDRENIIQPWENFFTILEPSNLKGLNFSKELMVGETYISVYPLGMTRSLRYLFSGS
jgi:hypothetical protein